MVCVMIFLGDRISSSPGSSDVTIFYIVCFAYYVATVMYCPQTISANVQCIAEGGLKLFNLLYSYAAFGNTSCVP